VNHETDSKVSVLAVDRGTLKEIQQISTLPPDFTGRNSTAEIQMDKAGRFLYVSNRGANTIAVYAVDPGKGTLTLRELVPALVNRHATSRSIQPADTSSPPTSFQTTW
jgi:6-phosphogluconolactonase (cycloisomerase 2 family)